MFGTEVPKSLETLPMNTSGTVGSGSIAQGERFWSGPQQGTRALPARAGSLGQRIPIARRFCLDSLSAYHVP